MIKFKNAKQEQYNQIKQKLKRTQIRYIMPEELKRGNI